MKFLILPLFLALAATPLHAAGCDTGKIEAALASPVDGLKKLERDVTDIQSTEGGVWQIYREQDGRVHSIVRIDGGESGRSERRLSVVNRKAYGIAVTRVDYLRHAFIETAGPNGTAKRTTDYYYYCEGKLLVPPNDVAMFDTEAYAKAGDDAQAAMVKDKDIADFTKGLAR
jgi:hypothetical protein